MKKSKKYISIIISLLVVSFMITGFISSPKTTMALTPICGESVGTCISGNSSTVFNMPTYDSWRCSLGDESVRCEKEKINKALCGGTSGTCAGGEPSSMLGDSWTCTYSNPLKESETVSCRLGCGEYYTDSIVHSYRMQSDIEQGLCLYGQLVSGSIVHYKTAGMTPEEREGAVDPINDGRFYNCYRDVGWQCVFDNGEERSCDQCVPYGGGEPYNGECGNVHYKCGRGSVIENSKSEDDTSYTWICAV